MNDDQLHKTDHKQCKLCKELKPLTEFYENYKAADGRHTKCKPCAVQIARDARLKKKQAKESTNG